EGTSFATPLVTGAVVLLQQIYQSRFGTLPTVDQLKSWLQQGADPVYDSATGITLGRLDVVKAAGLIPQPAPPPAPVPTPAPGTGTQAAAPLVSAPPAAPALPAVAATSNVAASSVHPVSPSQESISNGTTAVVPSFQNLLQAMSVWAAADGTGGWTTGAV